MSVVFVLVAGACAGTTSEAAVDPAVPAPSSGGLFTSAQSDRGEAVFAGQCASCHAQGEFAGRTFGLRWDGRPIGEIFRFIQNSMPYDSPGSLTPQQYIDVTAFLLQLNGYPAGPTDLTPESDALNQVTFAQPR